MTKIMKRIKLNNGELVFTAKEDGVGIWTRNGKVMTSLDLEKYRYYDSSLGGYRKLDRLGNTPVATDYLTKLQDDSSKLLIIFPSWFNPSKERITLNTRGSQHLVTIPLNVLDSIAINSGRGNTDFKTNLGLVGKESTFGNFSFPIARNSYKNILQGNNSNDTYRQGVISLSSNNALSNEEIQLMAAQLAENEYDGKLFSPYYLTNNHAYFTNKYDDYHAAIIRKVKTKEDPYGKTDKNVIKAEKLAEDAYKNNRFTNTTPHYHNNIMADAFIRYKKNPNKYNPGQKNYAEMVTKISNNIWADPQILLYWNIRGIKWFNKGLKEYENNK